jgi:hypothetical protein
VRLRFHLTPLSEEDMRDYVAHRLEVAGANSRSIFADACFPLLYRYTGGVPRLINTLCETAMIAAFGEDRDRINAGDMRTAISELGWVDYAARKAALERAQHAHEASLAAEPLEQTFSLPQEPVAREPALYIGDTRASTEVLARIAVLQDNVVLGEMTLQAGRVVIGRTTDNDLQIDSRLISRKHCQLVSTREHTVIEDMGSTNGLVVAGRRLKRYVLKDGDVVQLGAHALRYTNARQDDDIALPDLPPLEEGDVAA